jgi:hypothetical protein
MSDTASRLSAFESRFDSITQSLSSALQALQTQSIQQAQEQKDQLALVNILNPKGATCNGGYRAKQTLLFYILLF